MAMILDGKKVAAEIDSRAAMAVACLKKSAITPKLCIIRLGSNAHDISYENSAIKRAESIGVAAEKVSLCDSATESELLETITVMNNRRDVNGILLLRPLPNHIAQSSVCDAISPHKDIDGVTPASIAGVFSGSGDFFPPCTAKACMEILKYYAIDCNGKHAVVVGRSMVVGKPLSMMLLGENATVTICHSKTNNLMNITRNADIVITCIGKPEALGADYFSRGQVIIDVGINWCDKKKALCGDVAFDEVGRIVKAITPVPGGVGTVTTSILISHVVESAKIV